MLKLPSCPSGRACHPLLPHRLRSRPSKLLGAVQNRVLFPYVPKCRCLEKPNKEQTESSELSQPLLSKQGPLLFSQRETEKKLAVCCPFPFPVGSGKQLAIGALSLGQSPAGLCSVPAGRMGWPGQGSEGFHSLPPLILSPKPTTLSALKVSFYPAERVCCRWFYPRALPAYPGGDFTEELYPLLEDPACGS